jgi:hypothetical protein
VYNVNAIQVQYLNLSIKMFVFVALLSLFGFASTKSLRIAIRNNCSALLPSVQLINFDYLQVRECKKGIVGKPVTFLVETSQAGPGNLEVTGKLHSYFEVLFRGYFSPGNFIFYFSC